MECGDDIGSEGEVDTSVLAADNVVTARERTGEYSSWFRQSVDVVLMESYCLVPTTP